MRSIKDPALVESLVKSLKHLELIAKNMSAQEKSHEKINRIQIMIEIIKEQIENENFDSSARSLR